MGAGAGAKSEPTPPPSQSADLVGKRLPLQPSCRALLEIVFHDAEGTPRTITFTKKPLGFEIRGRQTPIAVRNTNPDSWAERLGVQAGWTIVSVAGEDMNDVPWEEAMSFLVQSVDALPKDIKVVAPAAEERSVEMTFDTDAEGVQKTVVFLKRPLGLEFEVEAPVRITKVVDKSVGQRLGVQVGWVIRKLNGQDLDGMTFSEQFSQLKKTVERLPNMYASIAPHAGLTVNSDGKTAQSERPVGPDGRPRGGL